MYTYFLCVFVEDLLVNLCKKHSKFTRIAILIRPVSLELFIFNIIESFSVDNKDIYICYSWVCEFFLCSFVSIVGVESHNYLFYSISTDGPHLIDNILRV